MTTFPRTLDKKLNYFAALMKQPGGRDSFYRSLVRVACLNMGWSEECSRCLGSGKFSCWSHVSNGRCFRCSGNKWSPILTKKNCEKLQSMIADGSIIEKVIHEDDDALLFISDATNALMRAKSCLNS